MFLAGFFVLWSIRVVSYDSIDGAIASPTWRALYSNLLKFILWVLPAWIFVAQARSSSPAKYLGVSVNPSLRRWLSCLAVTAVFLVVVALFESFISRKSFSGIGLTSLSASLVLLQFVVSPLLEEILFRGLVMREIMNLAPTPVASMLTSLFFLGAHLPYWLSHDGLAQATLAQALGVFVFSVLACSLYARTASIWPPTLAHIANNVLAATLVAKYHT